MTPVVNPNIYTDNIYLNKIQMADYGKRSVHIDHAPVKKIKKIWQKKVPMIIPFIFERFGHYVTRTRTLK